MRQLRPVPVGSEVTIAASPEAVYALITDLSTLTTLADEVESMSWRTGCSAQPGAVFKGHNRNGRRRWTTTCTVTDAEPGHVFAFNVRLNIVPIAHWRYEIEQFADGGCRVAERTWDHRPGWLRKSAPLATGVNDRAAVNSAHISATLRRLRQLAESR